MRNRHSTAGSRLSAGGIYDSRHQEHENRNGCFCETNPVSPWCSAFRIQSLVLGKRKGVQRKRHRCTSKGSQLHLSEVNPGPDVSDSIVQALSKWGASWGCR
jgi:hypothetical protein